MCVNEQRFASVQEDPIVFKFAGRCGVVAPTQGGCASLGDVACGPVVDEGLTNGLSTSPVVWSLNAECFLMVALMKDVERCCQ